MLETPRKRPLPYVTDAIDASPIFPIDSQFEPGTHRFRKGAIFAALVRRPA